MRLLTNRKLATTLDDASFRKVLDMYPEERFAARGVMAEALQTGELTFEHLKVEAAKMLVPWQLFFLEPAKLDAELARIESLRHQKAPALVAKRAGRGSLTSRRILDRLLRWHAYLSAQSTLGQNPFCGALKRSKSLAAAADAFCKYFALDMRNFRSRSKSGALAYLIRQAEAAQINVCQGVLSNRILPQLADSRSVYKNTSGFVIGDDALPLVFLPSEVNPDEHDGRQILTLTYLLVLIGLEAYNYYIDRDFTARMLQSTGMERTAYDITAEILFPSVETEALRGISVTAELRDDLARRCKLTPTAIIVILRRRGILSASDYDTLVPPLPPARGRKRKGAQVPVASAVRKFAGQYVFDVINRNLAAGALQPVQAQHLLFGSVNKRAFREYRKSLGI